MSVKSFIKTVTLVAMAAALVLFGCGGGGGSGAGELVTEVTIDGKTWMKRNLNVEADESWCYNNNPSNCKKYGRLYTWEAAKNACANLGGGWHLPSDDDWSALTYAVGGFSMAAGRKLKSRTGWSNNGNGDDEFGFSALPGGTRVNDGRFGGVGDVGIWWTATDGAFGASDGFALYRVMSHDHEGVESNVMNPKSHGYSVRCIKN